MTLRAIKRKRTKGHAKKYFAGFRFFAGVYIFWGALIITAVSFISLSAAFMTFAFFTLGLFGLQEVHKRKQWEAATRSYYAAGQLGVQEKMQASK